ncbi:MAG TPA: D-aminoacylase [Candidatus Tectomicrobia bacterium]|nr:D-aminoacylase [Candidatus Tectomicrobia bacterium]
MWDLFIQQARVVDGSGAPAFVADIAVRGDTIAEVGQVAPTEARLRIDGTGLTVGPGFIDLHTHSDYTLLVNPLAESKVHQGVTTEVIGNCGTSPAPLGDEAFPIVRARMAEQYALEVNWRTFAGYLERLAASGSAVNVVPIVGHGTVRSAVMGYAQRQPTASELARMKALIADAMAAGAFGLSTGLVYAPGCYADTDEIVELARVVKDAGGMYFSHIRGETDTVLEAAQEAITVGERAGVPVQISHLKTAGRANWEKTPALLDLIDQANAHGLDVTGDVYPYTAGATSLGALLPPWVHEGGLAKLLPRLRDPQVRTRIRQDIERGLDDWWNPAGAAGWSGVQLSRAPKHQSYQGLRLSHVAALRQQEPLEATLDILLAEEGNASVVLFMMDEAQVRRILRQGRVMIGSDAGATAPYGVLGRGHPHPRAYGTFPRVLGTYARDLGVVSLEEAIHRMTGLTAWRLGLADRGLVRPGYKADLVIFDAQRLADRATYDTPHVYPTGIQGVIVNGQCVLRHGERLPVLPGRVLLRNSHWLGGRTAADQEP